MSSPLLEEEFQQVPGSSNSNANPLDVPLASDGTRRGVCNLIVLSQFSVPGSDSRKLPSLNPISYENAFAIDLAIRHLNERNGSIIPEIQNLEGTCNIDFVGEYIDTEDDAVTAAKRVTSRLDQVNDTFEALAPSYNPCAALIGATSSYSESIQTSIVANMKGYSFVSGMNHGTVLSHKRNFPRFARTIPSNRGPASALVKYIRTELDYKYNRTELDYEYKFLVILRANTDHSNDYASSIRHAISDDATYVVREIFVLQDGSNVKESIERLRDLRITTVIAVFEGVEYSSNLYDVVMEEAYNEGVAGDDHVWFFPEAVLEYSLYLQKLRNPKDYEYSPLYHAYRGSGIIKSGRVESKYWDLVDGIQKHSQTEGYMDYMESVLPNPFREDNVNATRNLLHEESFLNNRTLDSRIEFLYEATVLVGLSACKAAALTDGVHLSVEDFYNTLVRYDFEGISGLVTLDDVSGSRIQNSTEYSIMNVRPANSNPADFSIEIRHTSTITLDQDLVEVERFLYNDETPTKPTEVWITKIETEVLDTWLICLTSFFCILSVGVCLLSMIWTHRNRNTRIIRASQPFFLHLISVGSIFVALTMVPMIFVASVEVDEQIRGICANLTAWCFFTGTSIIVSSFFCKLRRINKIMEHSRNFRRIKVGVRDAILPVVIAISANVLILSLMAATPHGRLVKVIDSDQFNRPRRVYQATAFWSECMKYTLILILVDVALIAFACFEAWKARNLSTEFQENEAIGRCLLVLLFTLTLAVPVLALSRNIHVRTFLLTAVLAILCLSVQGFLFGEKYLYQRRQVKKGKASDNDPGADFSGEKLFSKMGRQQLALENQNLRARMAKSQKETDGLRLRLRESMTQNNQAKKAGDLEEDLSDTCTLSESMKPSESMKRLKDSSAKDESDLEDSEVSDTYSLSNGSMKKVRNPRLYSQWDV